MESISEIFNQKQQKKAVKPPAYPWQDLALKIIKELDIPNFKRSSVFKVCKDYPENKVMAALNDTKELCQEGNKWQYFFKVITEMNKK